jgi:hypothetical protein
MLFSEKPGAPARAEIYGTSTGPGNLKDNIVADKGMWND